MSLCLLVAGVRASQFNSLAVIVLLEGLPPALLFLVDALETASRAAEDFFVEVGVAGRFRP